MDRHHDIEAGAPAPASAAACLAAARAKSVFLATPVARHPVRQYTLAMIDTVLLLERQGIRFELRWVVGNSNLPRARNELAAEFLASGCTDMLWIDDDMGWRAADVVRLLASDKDYIGGVGRKKTGSSDTAPETWCARFPRDGSIRQDAAGAIEVDGLGTGFCKMSRRVFEAIANADSSLRRPPPPDMRPEVGAHLHSFFRFFDLPDGLVSEDIAFCAAWRACGGTVWADPAIALVHVGEHEFTGSFAALLQPEEN